MLQTGFIHSGKLEHPYCFPKPKCHHEMDCNCAMHAKVRSSNFSISHIQEQKWRINLAKEREREKGNKTLSIGTATLDGPLPFTPIIVQILSSIILMNRFGKGSNLCYRCFRSSTFFHIFMDFFVGSFCSCLSGENSNYLLGL